MIKKLLFTKIAVLISIFTMAQSADRVPQWQMQNYVMAFLKSGPKRDMPKAEADKIQAAHLNYISEMAKNGKLIIAGPFDGKGDVRGIFIFNCSEDEAKTLTMNDPAVKAGRLIMELHNWYGLKDLIDFAEEANFKYNNFQTDIKSFTSNIGVSNMETSINFYRNNFGFIVIDSLQGDDGNMSWAMLRYANTRLMLQEENSLRSELPEGEQRNNKANQAFFIEVQSASEMFEKMQGKMEMIKELHKTSYGSTEFTVIDPDGYILTFASFEKTKE